MLWQQLEQALAAEVELLGRTVDLAERKQRALTTNRVAELEALLPEEEQLASELQALEFELTGIASQLAGKIGVRTLEEVINSPACPRPAALGQLFEQMVIRLASLQQLNGQNRLLIEQALQFIDYSLRVIVSSPEDPAYDAEGRTSQKAKPRLLDRKL
ncbi:MAG: flagellar protein FlgN [Firmicutes bacterium]|nr:flagellar protein FlgN [Bacillota bacterium]